MLIMSAQKLVDEIATGAKQAAKRIGHHVIKTPLVRNERLSDLYECDVFIKREDLQVVRSFKLRGALNKMMHEAKTIKPAQQFVCASAGNHAQGFAYSCRLLKKKGVVFMPSTAPEQKVNQVKYHGKGWVVVELYGDNFDACLKKAKEFELLHNAIFIHPYNDERVIHGQATVGLEILSQSKKSFDYLLCAVGGGGFISGVSAIFHKYSPHTLIYACEPKGALSMKKSIDKGKVISLSKYDSFIDGAAVARVGDIPFEICKHTLHEVLVVPEGKVCTSLIHLYNNDAIVAEPAGALAIAGLDSIPKKELKGKQVCVIISGGNNDFMRMPEIRERSLLYEGLKYYFIIEFPQRPGAFKDFLDNVLEAHHDIVFFEYMKKTNRSSGPALVGIESKTPHQYNTIVNRLKKHNFSFQFVNDNLSLFRLIL